VLQQPHQLAPVGLCAACLLAVDFGAPLGAQLLKLRVESLAVGADGRSRGGGFSSEIRSYLMGSVAH
jgi:hypothetical protein